MTIIHFFLAALALGILVLIHELGHLLAAKAVGMNVEAFSIGFGPALFKKVFRDVEYRIGCIPFGGYVRIKGMERKGKNADGQPISVYDIPQGFFSRPPWKRIIVLLAGPVANILLAMIAFWALYLSGGRSKNFGECSRIVGWIHPTLQAKGLRAGDQIRYCNGKPYEGDKEAMTSALLEGRLALDVFRPSYLKAPEKDFSLEVEFDLNREGIPCIGANYLLFKDNAPMSERSPLIHAGLESGDRLVWMDGALLFSSTQVSQILNEAYAFVKIIREGEELFFRIPRVLASSLYFSPYVRNELIDTQYEAGLKGKWTSLYTLPYVINSYGYVEGELVPIDSETPLPPSAKHLQIGDRIVAVDGTLVSSSADILRLVQTHRVSMIIQHLKAEDLKEQVSSQADERFVSSFYPEDLLKIIKNFGSTSATHSSGQYRLLEPIQPQPWVYIYSEENLNRQRDLAKKIKNREKQRYYLDRLEVEKQKLSLGAPFKDLMVKYNPSPNLLMIKTTKDSVATLKALISGHLSPRWLAGPVGIVQVLHSGWSVGFSEVLFWIGLISMNLAILNLLPIPALDGGYILLCLWEMLTRRRLNMGLIEKIIVPFMFLLILFFIFLTFQDLFRFVK
ncbi:site-2 protease family protein [Chlamydia sp. 17-3921]|uniref:site-2 protease family protein n=1 Tax=Chlamydia sp. 17-3921 TaxID=2675798 RepID=UPI00191A2CE7|nr:site-2 protease family protein [Chlamydia sp. 17-3921]